MAPPGPEPEDSSHRREVTKKRDVLKSAGLSTSAANRYEKIADIPEKAGEIKLRAERKAGELLNEMADSGERATDGRPQKQSHAATISEMGITKSQSSRWQALGKVPEAAFRLRGPLRARQERDLAAGGALWVARRPRCACTGFVGP